MSKNAYVALSFMSTIQQSTAKIQHPVSSLLLSVTFRAFLDDKLHYDLY